jgi:beta-glucosidase
VLHSVLGTYHEKPAFFNGLLDKGSLKSIAVLGPRANEVLLDWYSGTPPYRVTPLEGIRAKAGPGVTVNFL